MKEGIWIESEYVRGVKQWDMVTPLFYFRVQDNGENWFNWWVSPRLMDDRNHIFREDLAFVQGGADSEVSAKHLAFVEIMDMMSESRAKMGSGHQGRCCDCYDRRMSKYE